MKKIIGILESFIIVKHSEVTGIRIIVDDKEQSYYGNTLRMMAIFEKELPSHGDTIFVEIEGKKLYNFGLIKGE